MKKKHAKKASLIATTSILGTIGILNQSVVAHAVEVQTVQNQVQIKSLMMKKAALRFLEGTAYYDENNDGIGDMVLANTALELIGPDGSVMQGSTDSMGYFYFEGMLLGDFTLRFYLNVVDNNGAPSIDVVDTQIVIDKNIANRIKMTIAPTGDVPTTETPTTEAPTTETPTTEVPTTEIPTTEVPITEIPTTEAPTTEAPTTEVPTTEVPTTEVPTTETPTTETPTTEAPTTEAPTTEVPTTEVPTTE
ncbi:hypothetical protein, partial [Macrococcus capreoli]|uniref:hypothetical protein n=1 Tax=Macrococcus capreoli TaxID=2982690 RepID=UPI003F434E2F